MKVLLTHVALGRGGDAVQWMSLAEGFRRTGHQVFLAGASAIAPYSVEGAGARARGLVRRLPWWIRDALEIGLGGLAIARAWGVARRQRVDLIVHRAATYDVVGAVLARLLGVPVIGYLDAHVPAERAYRSESYWRWLHERSVRHLGRRAALLVVPSQALRDYYHGIGIPLANVLVRPNGVFQRHIRLGLEALRSAPPMARPSVCVVGFAGSLSDWHRVDLLLDALALLTREEGPVAYRLIIIGAGREEARLKAHATRLGVTPLVDWRGPLSHDRAVEAMREFDVAVLPSTLATGAPMKLFEYAAMGRPIVAPALPNISALFVPGVDAVLVEPGSPSALAAAVAGLAADPARAQRIGRAGQARVLGFTWEETAALLVQAASERAGSPARRPPRAVNGAHRAAGY